MPSRSHQLWRAILQDSYHNFWKFSLIAFFLGCFLFFCFVFAGWEWLGVITEAFYVPPSQLWVCRHQYNCQSSFLALYSQREHGVQTPTWFLNLAHAMDLSMVSGSSRPQAINMAFCCTTGSKHNHGPWQQHKPRTSTWPQVATQTTHINIASSDSMAHGHQHGFRG